MVSFAVLTVFWLFLVHCWYTVCIVLVDMWRLVHQQQKWPLVYQSSHARLIHCWYRPTVYQSSKTVKTAKMSICVPIVTGLPRLYQQCNKCTNRQKQSNSKNDHWCTNRHMSTHYTIVRRIHKAMHAARFVLCSGFVAGRYSLRLHRRRSRNSSLAASAWTGWVQGCCELWWRFESCVVWHRHMWISWFVLSSPFVFVVISR